MTAYSAPSPRKRRRTVIVWLVVVVVLGALLAHALRGPRTIVQPKDLIREPAPGGSAECPPDTRCTFQAAAFAQANSQDPKSYGNYDKAQRPKDLTIKYIVIHTAEGSYDQAVSWFKDPSAGAAAHYVIHADGQITQMVNNKDVAWHAGNTYMNLHSIGIEHEGYAAEGAKWYTDAMYQSSAKLVRYLAEEYDIPLDREHIVGHDQYHGLTAEKAVEMHPDPGPFWNWERYMQLLGATPVTAPATARDAVTIAPPFVLTQERVANCSESGDCPAQGTNFVYVRSRPQDDAPLLADTGLHSEYADGTTDINDWGSRAIYGQRFAVAARQGDWIAIWFGGQKGWVRNAGGKVALPAEARLITPKPGKKKIAVYGRPMPESKAFIARAIKPQRAERLQYSILAGQRYIAYEKKAVNDYLQVETFDRREPGEGTILFGKEAYIPISYNHRQAFVKANDVDIVS